FDMLDYFGEGFLRQNDSWCGIKEIEFLPNIIPCQIQSNVNPFSSFRSDHAVPCRYLGLRRLYENCVLECNFRWIGDAPCGRKPRCDDFRQVRAPFDSAIVAAPVLM